jgi:hypothetical protein
MMLKTTSTIKAQTPKGGVAKPLPVKSPTTKRTYTTTMSKAKKDALEALHSTRENKHAKQRELEELIRSTPKDVRQTQEKEILAAIDRLKCEEAICEMAFKSS